MDAGIYTPSASAFNVKFQAPNVYALTVNRHDPGMSARGQRAPEVAVQCMPTEEIWRQEKGKMRLKNPTEHEAYVTAAEI